VSEDSEDEEEKAARRFLLRFRFLVEAILAAAIGKSWRPLSPMACAPHSEGVQYCQASLWMAGHSSRHCPANGLDRSSTDNTLICYFSSSRSSFRRHDLMYKSDRRL
jgi:hypothetical protein